jgi:hypothetical protein
MVGSPCLRALLGYRTARQAHRKHRALARFARHGHVAAHHARELAGDGKAKPRAAEALSGGGIGLGEFFEQFCLLLCGHADAGVGDCDSTKLLPLLTLRAASLTSPALVNLHALLNRLSSICRSRMGSTVNSPRFSWASTTRRFLFCSQAVPRC